MRKMFKAAASLAVGCAMLSTSAFAALTGTPALSDDRSAVNVTVSGVGADKESTILVLKGDLPAMPATINDDDIVYIYQKTAAADGTATYSMPLGTRVGNEKAVTVFAGATDEVAAARLGSVTLASEPGRDFITETVAGKATVTSAATAAKAGTAWSFTGYSEEVTIQLDSTAYPNAADETAGYSIKVVDANGDDVAGASVFYSVERSKYIVLLPENLTAYKYEVVSGGNKNTKINRYGDVLVNAQNTINLSDAAITTRAVKGLANLTDLQKVTADVILDGKVNLSDVAAIIRYAKGLSSTFPVLSK